MTGPIRPTPPDPMGPTYSSDTGWQRSSFCVGGECVEVRFVRSSLSMTGATCVEVAVDGDRVMVRDSKDPAGAPLLFTPEEWRMSLALIRDGDLPVGYCKLLPHGDVLWTRADRTLQFTDAEWMSFCSGVDNGEFDFDLVSAVSARPDAAVSTVGRETGQRAAVDAAGGEPCPDHGSSPVAPLAGPDARTAAALVQLCKPELDPWDSPEAYGLRWATAVFEVAERAAFGKFRAGDGIPAWRSGPLVHHVPAPLNDFEDSPASSLPGDSAVEESCGTVGGEVAPGAVGVPQSPGATDPVHVHCYCHAEAPFTGCCTCLVVPALVERDEILP
jgi:hypothetical protein